jgi:hypothetical protein
MMMILSCYECQLVAYVPPGFVGVDVSLFGCVDGGVSVHIMMGTWSNRTCGEEMMTLVKIAARL